MVARATTFRRGQWAVSCVLALACCRLLQADVVTTKTNLQYEGNLGRITAIGEDIDISPDAKPNTKPREILLIDDTLRRTFIPTKQYRTFTVNEDARLREKILIRKKVYRGTRRIAGVGPALRVTPFDRFGNRTFSFATPRGQINVIQGITEITPLYTTLQGLQTKSGFEWTMRLATSSVSRQVLSTVIKQNINPKNVNDRLQIVRLFTAADRYQDAERELEEVIADFPGLTDLAKQVSRLQQRKSAQAIRELEFRREAGQHQFVRYLLSNFDETGVAGELQLRVKEVLDQYAELRMSGERATQLLDQHMQQVTVKENRDQLEAVVDEIKLRLNWNTLDRMADYLRLSDDAALKPEQKLALAISGWLLGGGAGIENLGTALPLFQVRNLVLEYLKTDTVDLRRRREILEQLAQLEGSGPEFLAKLIAHMAPPLDPPQLSEEDTIGGLFQLSVPMGDAPPLKYLIQLPPEYDPLRRYPTVLSLHDANTTPAMQIDWWAGIYNQDRKRRLGQATRHGYIVIAPAWSEPKQRQYQFSFRAHAAVLKSLRDATKRFSIDTDRVFLSGAGMGGDAAWDIGLAHPDVWAGVIPIVATADRYILFYTENGRRLPMYFVGGELDGNRLVQNRDQWNDYLTHHSYDATIVLFQGRGHEDFHDEIQRIFDWMAVHRRQFFQDEFLCLSMRPWDNYFWWAEVDQLPPRSMIWPTNWKKPSGRPARIDGRIIRASNRVRLTTGADRAVVWLSPEMIDFDQPLSVSINGKKIKEIDQGREVMLNDVRTRGDRQHPFWAKAELR